MLPLIRKGMESNINIASIDLGNHIIYIYSSNFLERNSIALKGLTKLVNFNLKELQLANWLLKPTNSTKHAAITTVSSNASKDGTNTL